MGVVAYDATGMVIPGGKWQMPTMYKEARRFRAILRPAGGCYGFCNV